ncbi:MAG: DNA repair protein RecO [Candidatus Neomarinimicrobiota bacterium]
MSTPHSSEAVVLRMVNYSDTSLIVRLFTELYGKVTVIAKGARRIKQGVVGLLQPPNHLAVWYHHKEQRDVQNLAKSEFVERYPRLAGQLPKSAAAMVAIEMLDRAVQDSDPHPLIFRLITSTLRRLDQLDGEERTVLHFFQLHLARQLGFAPHFHACERCGRTLSSATMNGATGRLLCTQCQPRDTIRISGPALKHLQDLTATHISQLQTLSPADKASREVGDFLLQHLFYHVDGMRNLRSIKFWERVSA